MKSYLRSLLGVFGLSLLSANAQSTLPVTDTVILGGLTTQPQGQSQAWAYLFWQTDALDLINARSYSVWQKPGDAAAAGNFSRVGIVKLQSDPAAVSGIIERSRIALGENVQQLDGTITAMFESLMPSLTSIPAPQRLGAKVSAVLRGVATDSNKVQSLALLTRYQPSVAMAVGQAFAAKIPSAGAVTFELREYAATTDTDVAVLGRVTVNHTAPIHLPPPSVVYQIPELPQAGFNHLNVKLVWDTPDALRKLSPFSQGANVYRVKRSTAEANGWATNPPLATKLATDAGTPGTNVGRVNPSPIMPRKLFTALQTTQALAGDQLVVDDATHMPGYPAIAARPKNGDQYYYFVTTRDVLGHENTGPSSPGLLVTFCDRLLPDAPVGLKVTNEYTYANGISNQNLRITWDANDNSGLKQTKSYIVYRWDRTDGPLKLVGNPLLPISLDPSANKIAGPIPHIPGEKTFSYLDNGPGSPNTTTDLNRTIWYTVRAVDDSDVSRPPGGIVCNASPFGGNISPNGPAAFGTLRDRVGPDAPNGTVKILCPVPGIVAGTNLRTLDNTLDPSSRFIELIATRPAKEENIAAVDFERQTGATWTSLGRVHFSLGATSLTRFLKFNAGDYGSPITVRARTINSTGDMSPFVSMSFPEPPALAIIRPTWITSVNYIRVPLTTAAGTGRCAQHTPPPADSGVNPPGGTGIVIEFTPPPTTRQYKLFYRIDSGPLTLAKEASANFTANQILTVVGDVLPAVTSEVCLFLQCFDLDGNPSPMKALGCMPVKGSTPLQKPMLAPIIDAGSQAAPVAQLQWFCPPPGVDKFEVWICGTPATLPTSLGDGLNRDPQNPEGNCIEQVAGSVFANYTYQIYQTEHVGPLFGNGSIFNETAGVASGQKLRVKVRAITLAGEAGPFSNVETYQWTAPPPFSGPDVPWAARSLPMVGGAGPFNGTVEPFYFSASGFVGISIGSFNSGTANVVYQGRSYKQIPAQGKPEDLLFKAEFTNPVTLQTVLPCIVYRTQLPDVPTASKPQANYPTVPGDMIQVSPLMETISYATEPAVGGGTGLTIYDPFIHIASVSLGTTVRSGIYLKDTTPVISGARYQYLLVLMDPVSHEVSHVLPLPVIDIP